MDTLYPGERHRRPCISAPAGAIPPLAEPAAARTWLDAERANLVAVAAYTAGDGWAGDAIRLASTVFRYLEIEGHYPEAVTITAHARRAAQDIGDLAAEARALSDLAVIDLRQSRFQQAETNLRQALGLYRQTSDPTGRLPACLATSASPVSSKAVTRKLATATNRPWRSTGRSATGSARLVR